MTLLKNLADENVVSLNQVLLRSQLLLTGENPSKTMDYPKKHRI